MPTVSFSLLSNAEKLSRTVPAPYLLAFSTKISVSSASVEAGQERPPEQLSDSCPVEKDEEEFHMSDHR